MITGMVRSTDPSTSYAAAQAVSHKITDIQRDVLNWFISNGGCGTDEQLEEALKHKYPAQTTVSKRRTDLVRKGLMRDSGMRQKNSNNRNMIVWSVV